MREPSRHAVRLLAATLLAAAVASAPALASNPDLIVDQASLDIFWIVEKEYFPPGHCALVEGCIDAAGYRKILRFETKTANIARNDLVMGDPSTNPDFHWSACHGHYHFDDFTDYKLLDPQGNVAAPGHKQAFCLLDTVQYINDTWVPSMKRFTSCSFQGIQRGWADVYDRSLDCQWIDVTGVPNGSYTLQVTVNPERKITESNYNNNTTTTPVTITDPPGIAHRPDGFRTPGQPLRASREGALTRILYDVAFCPAPDYNLLYGMQSLPGSYTYDGAVCDLGTSGNRLVSLPNPPPGQFVWFTVVGRLGTDEGGHGFDSAGTERPLTGQGRCSIFDSTPAFTCQ